MKKYIKLLIAVLFALPLHVNAQAIVTIAGNGNEGYSGDTSAAVRAQLHWPKSLAVDTFGNVYIADAVNNCIRKINTKGIITTIAGTGFEAGTGTGGFAGDGGPATLAHLYDPEGVAIDYKGNIYIADVQNNRVRKIDTAGKISTIAGSGTQGFLGDGGAAATAELFNPSRVAVDTLGFLYIADIGNNRVRRVDTLGIIITIAGNGTAGYSGDGGAAAATTCELNNPADIATDRKGNIFIADQLNECIRKVNAAGTITTYAGNNTAGFRGDGGAATAAQLFDPVGIAVDTFGNVYISDLGNQRIRMINDTGTITTICGNGIGAYAGDGGPAIKAELDFPQGLAVNRHGNLYIADQGNNRVRYLNAKSVFVINTNTTLAALDIYPNPSGGVFTVNVSSDINEQARIVITSVTGQKVNELDTYTNHPNKINIEAPPGMYFLSAITAHGVSSSKVVVY
jgi:sugar lactone lactonase YvrE